MTEPEREPCPRCGQPAAVEAMVCPRCRGSLATDVVVVAAVPDERQRYRLARSLSALGPPLLGLAAIRDALGAANGTVARGLSRGAAERLIATMGGDHEVQAVARLTDAAGAHAGADASRPTGATVLGLRSWPVLAVAVATVAVMVATAGLAVRWVGRRLSGVVATRTLSPADLQGIADKVRLSRGRVYGPGMRGGAGFFVAPDLILALAHPAGAEVAQANYGDRRQGSGSVVHADAELGLVLVLLPGAHADPLPLADATAVRDGDVLVVVDQDRGRVVAKSGSVTHAAAVRDGRSLIQMDVSLSDDPWGSPVLDTRGRAVGLIVRSNPAARLAWVLPINYAFDWLPAPVDHDRAEWARRTAAPTQALEARDHEFAAVENRPVLLQARYGGVATYDAAQAILVERFSLLLAAPAWWRTNEPASVRVRIGPCDLDARISWWPDTFRGDGSGRGAPLQAFERWAAAEGLRERTVVGDARATLDRRQCPTEGTREVVLLHKGEAVSTVPLED